MTSGFSTQPYSRLSVFGTANMGVKLRFLTVFFLCFVLPELKNATKYSKNANAKMADVDSSTFKKPFRINKLNAIWHKARKRLADVELEEFHAELIVQDQVELDWKKRKADGLDEDGEQEAAVRRKLMSVLRRYKLDDYMDHPDMNKLPDQKPGQKDLSGVFHPAKLDRKLEKIWKKAQMSGFSKSELDKLKEELTHQQEKMDEFELLKNDINQMASEESASMNSVNRFKDEEISNRAKKSELKKKFAEIKEGYGNIEEYLRTGPDDSLEPLTFNDPRVIDLWMMAKKSNFTARELISFKEELTHLEHKLKKHEYMKQELGAQSEGRKTGTPGSDPETLQKMERKVHDYERRIKKHHTELKMRVADAARSEL